MAITLLAALALAMPMQSRAVVAPVPGYSVSPNPAPADKAFTLYLNGASSGCNTTFSRESVTVVGKVIDLSYVANSYIPVPGPMPADPTQPTTGIVCPVYDQTSTTPNIMIPPYVYGAPTYSMPALKAGTYEVWVTQMYECLYTQPSCKIAVQRVSAGSLTVQPDTTSITYSITPTSTMAAQAFDLSLLSYQFNCGTTFDNLSTAVSGNTITLTFLDHQNIGIACPAIYKAYGPAYKEPALKAGTYTVMAYRLPACYPCKLAGESAVAGTLTVTGTGTVDRKGWFLKEHTVAANKAFSMQVLNQDYGNCQTTFSHQTVNVQSGNIYTTFLVETNPARVCVADIHPWGPTFDMQAMKTGMYPLYVAELLQCQVSPPYCGAAIVPVLSDTLVVSGSASILMSELRRSPQVEWHGSRAAFLLPQDGGRGVWKAELLTLSGRRLASVSMTGESGQRAEAELGFKPERGVYLLRLSAPGGEIHLLPFVRKN
jgi:hypothetical protein